MIEQRRPGIRVRDRPFRGLVLLLARDHEQRGHPLPVHDGLRDFVVLGLLHTSDFPVLLLPPGGTGHSSNLLKKPGDPIYLPDLSRVTDADAVRSNAHEVAVPVVQRLQRELETAALDDQQTPYIGDGGEEGAGDVPQAWSKALRWGIDDQTQY